MSMDSDKEYFMTYIGCILAHSSLADSDDRDLNRQTDDAWGCRQMMPPGQ